MLRVRDGRIVASRDSHDHLALAAAWASFPTRSTAATASPSAAPASWPTALEALRADL